MTTSDPGATSGRGAALAHATARVGTTLRKAWHLDTLLGAGAMIAVYAATNRDGGRAAIEILHADLSGERSIRNRFVREAYLANAIDHRGVVRVLQDGMAEDGSLFLVTELLDGETLAERRTRLGGRLPVDEVLLFADQLLEVVAAGHAKGIVHRGINPKNLFFTRSGVLKVLDFGLARVRELAPITLSAKNGMLLGMPRFMPPEQVRGLTDEIDARSDLWACGATMFELLSGRHVHQGDTPHQVLMIAATTSSPRFASIAPDVLPSLASLIDRSLEFEKEKRWRDAGAMREAVQHAYQDRHGQPIATAAQPTIPDEVPNRTLASSSADAAEPHAIEATDRPVAVERRDELASGASLQRKKAYGTVIAVAAAGALLCILGTTRALRTMHSQRSFASSLVPTGLLPTIASPQAPERKAVAGAGASAAVIASPAAGAEGPAPAPSAEPSPSVGLGPGSAVSSSRSLRPDRTISAPAPPPAAAGSKPKNNGGTAPALPRPVASSNTSSFKPTPGSP
ncbi:MAG: serine/threonine-protein kinase [Polyangiaceae bacterium]|jgi:serine/threonine-protein kinase